jgi:hypothetical protein
MGPRSSTTRDPRRYFSRLNTYLLMTQIPEQPLDRIWMKLGNNKKARVKDQVSKIMRELW